MCLEGGRKDLCSRVSRAHWEDFKENLKEERGENRLARCKPEGSMAMVMEWYANKVSQFAIPVEVSDGES